MTIPPSANSAVESASIWLETLPDSSALIDESGTILAVNTLWQTFARANGVASQACLGESYLAVSQSFLDDEAGDLPQQLAEVLQGTSDSLEREYPCRSPSDRRWFRLTATRFLDQGRSYVVVVHRDISRRRLIEETARTREQQLESVLAHTREGLLVVQGERTVRYANPRACEFLGDSLEHLIGRNLSIPIPSSPGQTVELQPAGEEPRTLEIYDVQSDWQGEPAWLVHLHDVTDRVAVERALRENEDLLERTNQVARVGAGKLT